MMVCFGGGGGGAGMMQLTVTRKLNLAPIEASLVFATLRAFQYIMPDQQAGG